MNRQKFISGEGRLRIGSRVKFVDMNEWQPNYDYHYSYWHGKIVDEFNQDNWWVQWDTEKDPMSCLKEVLEHE